MIVIVSHADLIKMVLAHYLGTHLDLFQRIGLSPASLSVLALAENSGVRVLRVNDTGPLPPPPPKEEEKKKKSAKKKEKKNIASSGTK
jgi:probable phosphoglycerate mutase